MVRLITRSLRTGSLVTALGLLATSALAGTETLYTWGRNNWGQLGQASAALGYSNKPIPVLGVGGSGTLSGVIACSGYDHMLALLDTGKVVSWGLNKIDGTPSSSTITYQLGNGATGTYDGTPRYVLAAANTPLDRVVSVAAGANHSLAVKQDGTVVAWGGNANGQLGNNAAGVYSQFPVTVMKATGGPLEHIVAVAAGANFSVALDKTGNVWTWGLNNVGQAGTGDAADKLGAVQPHGATFATQGQVDPGGVLAEIAMISATDDHAMAVTKSGNAVAWGRNHNYGELGTNGNNGQAQKWPAWVVDINDTTQAGKGGSTKLANITAVNIGKEHAIALLNTGEVCTWGANESGQLAIGVQSSNSSRAKPGYALASSGVRLAGVTDIYSGLLWSITQKADRTVWAWGNDKTGVTGSDSYVGTLGQGSDLGAGQSTYPVQVVGAAGAGSKLTYISALGGGANTNWALMGVLEPLGQIAGYDGRSRIVSQAVGVATDDVYIVTLNYYGKSLDGYVTLTHPTGAPYLARTCRGGDGNIYLLFVDDPNTLTKACVVKIPETATSASSAVASAVENIANARGLAFYDNTTLVIFQHSGASTGALATIQITPPVSSGSSLNAQAANSLTRPAAGDVPVRIAVDATAGDPYKLRVLYRDSSGYIKLAQHATISTATAASTYTKTSYGAPIDLYIASNTLGAPYSSVVLSSTGTAGTTELFITAIQADGTVANTCTDTVRKQCGNSPNQPSPVSLAVSPSTTLKASDQSCPKILMRTNIGDYYYYASLGQTWPYRPGSARVWTVSSDLSNITYSTRAFRDLN